MHRPAAFVSVWALAGGIGAIACGAFTSSDDATGGGAGADGASAEGGSGGTNGEGGSGGSGDGGGGTKHEGGTTFVDAGPQCDPTQPFANPVQIAGLDPNAYWSGGWVTPDGAHLYASESTSSGPYVVHRFDYDYATGVASKDVVLALPSLPDATGQSAYSDPVTNDDGKVLFVTSVVAGPSFDIYRANLEGTGYTTSSTFGTPGFRFSPYLIDNQLWFTLVGSAGSSLVHVDVGANGLADDGATPAIVDPSYDYRYPVPLGGGLVLYYASTLKEGGTTYRVHRTTRTSAALAFPPGPELPELAIGGTTTVPTWISADECIIHLLSDATGGRYQIYEARRGP